ncbi:MAG: efflux RND transporter periplasmic adaptor subunit [Bacteroidales bacterium]|nr:efflux RND transporter periplasmic adaptor subunit [Bacteroidales bacterium]MBQ6576744.1 efflux RND transporter periplasmic adaptor subunit [Bacteroidales bacterium]
MKTAFKTIIVAASALILAGCGNKGGNTSSAPASPAGMPMANATPKVTVATALKKVVPQTETYSTTVEAFATNNIAPQSGSRIQKINVEVGDFVSKGQVLAEMDRLQLEQSRLALVNDSTELSRYRGLYEEGGVAKSDLEALELNYNVRKSTYQNLLENTILRAPISGVITARNYDKGDMYTMSQPIYVLQQITPVKLLVGISESDYTKVKKGDVVQITADALPGKEFSGRVNRIYPTVNAMTHTVNVEVLVTNNDRQLRPGMYAKALVNFESNYSVTVPEGAVAKQQGSGQRVVYVLRGDDTVEIRMVTLGRHFGNEYEILSGVSEGETVITKGQTSLKGGDKVEVVE